MSLQGLPFLGITDALAKGLVFLIKMIANAIYGPLDRAGLSIDSLILNIEDDASVSYFTLGSGNVYGILAAKLFVATRNIFLILVGLVFMFLLLRAAASPSPAKRMEAKSAVTNVALAMFMVAWAPAVLNFFFYLRKFFCETVYFGLGLDQVGGIGNAYTNGIGDTEVVKALMYLAFCIVGIYFAIFYISIAIMQLLLLGVFPIIALQGVSNPDMVRGWFKTFMGWMLIPMVDCVLFVVPIGIGANLNDDTSPFIMLICMFALMPVRKFVFSKLGIEAADVAGLIAAGTTGAMASAVERGAGKVKDTVAGAADDIKKAREDRADANTEDELAANERQNAEADAAVGADGTSPTSHGAPSEPGESSGSSGGASSSADAASAERLAVATEGSPISDMGRGSDDGADSSAESVGHGAEITASADGGADGGASENAMNGGAPIGDASSERDEMSGGRAWTPADTMQRQGGGRGELGDADDARAREAAIYGKRANVNNFEKYKGKLSHEQMAALYRQRSSVGRVAGSIVGRAVKNNTSVLGSQLGMVAGAMYGSSGANRGMRWGEATGETAGIATGAAANGLTRAGVATAHGVGVFVSGSDRRNAAKAAALAYSKENPDGAFYGAVGGNDEGGIIGMPAGEEFAGSEGGIIGMPAGEEFASAGGAAAPARETAFNASPIDEAYAGATEAELDTMVSGSVADGAEPASQGAMKELGEMYATSGQQEDAEAACADVFANGMQQRDGTNISNIDAIAAVFANTPDLGGYYGSEQGKAVPTMVFPTMSNAKGAYVGSVSKSMLAASVRNSGGSAINFSDENTAKAAKQQFQSLARTCQGKYVASSGGKGAYFAGLTQAEVNKHAEAIRILNGGASGQTSCAFQRLDTMRATAANANGGQPIVYNWSRTKTVWQKGQKVQQMQGRRMSGLSGAVATTAGSSEPVYARPMTRTVEQPVVNQQVVVTPQPTSAGGGYDMSFVQQEVAIDQAVAANQEVVNATTAPHTHGRDIDDMNYTTEELMRGMQIEAQRTYENRFVQDAMNRDATQDQIRRAEGVEHLFNHSPNDPNQDNTSQ